MNAAAIERSKRLQRFLGVLADGAWKSTLEIIKAANVVAVNSCASECRAQGIKVDCERRGHAWYYRLPSRINAVLAEAANLYDKGETP